MKHILPKSLLRTVLLWLTLLVASIGTPQAQVVTTGTDFWFTMLENLGPQTGPIGLRVYISSVGGATGTVSVPGCFFAQNFVCPPNGVVFVTLPNCAEPQMSGMIENKAIRVQSDNPVSIYSVNASDNTTDGTMVMPVNTLGYDYYVMAYKNQGGFSENSEFSFCAIMPNTQVEFTPSVNTTNGFPANVPQIITLNPGQMMQVQAEGDLTGTRVRVIGNNCLFPIAVFGGNRCTNVGPCTACDHLYEMMSPNASLGRQFVFVPTAPTLNSDIFRVLAVQNGTVVTVNGVAQPALNAGQYQTFDAIMFPGTSVNITSNNPIAVASYAKGGACIDIRVDGDPMMMMITPTDILGVTTVNMATVAVAPPNRHYINLVTATANTGNITVTPPPINCEPWNPVPGTPTLSTRRCEINPGSFNVTSTGTGFNIFQYGWGERDSYGMAGAGIVNQNVVNMSGSIGYRDSICTNSPKLFTALSNSPPLNLTWDWGDGSPIETGPANTHVTRSHTFIGCGQFRIKVQYTTNNGTFCAESLVNVWAKPSATWNPPQNVNVCAGQTLQIPVSVQNTCNGRLPWGNQSGIVPFEVHYTIDGVAQPPLVATRNQTVTLTTPPINACMRIRLVSIVNAYQPWTGSRCSESLMDSIIVCPQNNTPVTAIANPATICAGQSATLTASGAVSYNWNNGQFNGNPFVVSPITTTTYTVVGSNPNNNCTGSATVTVTVNPAPVAPTITPVNNVLFCLGQQNACFTASHPNNAVTFTWSNGQTGNTVCVPTNVLGNFNISVTASLNGCTSPSATVNYAVQGLTPVNPTPNQATVCSGQTATFAISNNLIQQGDQFFWRDLRTGIVTGPTNTYTTPPLVSNVIDPINGYPSPANFCVFRTNTNRPGCESICVQFQVNIVLPPVPAGRVIPNPICTNQITELEVTGPNLPAVRFNWYTVPNGGAPIFTNLVVGDRRAVGPFATPGTYTYYIESFIGNCVSQRVPVVVTVNPSSVAGTLSGNNSFCSGGNTTLTLAGQSGSIVRWESSINNFVTITNIANTTTTYTTPNLTQTTCYRVAVQNGNCPMVFTPPYCVQLDANPIAGTINPATRTVCQGSPVGNIVLSGSSGNIIWESSTDCPNFTTFTTINNTTTTLTEGVVTGTTCYRARVSRGVCPSVVSNVFTVSLDQPSVSGTISGNNTLCSGSNTTLTLSNSFGNILRWESSIDNFVTVTNIANTTITYTTPNLTQTTCYRTVVRNGVCPAVNSPSYCVQVDQPPVAGTLPAPNMTICQGNVVGNIVLSGSSGNIVWESSTNCPTFSTLTTINNTTSTLTVGALNTTTCYRVKVSRGVCPNVYSNVFTVFVDLPSLGGNLSGTNSLCSGGTSTLTLTGQRGNILRWESSTNNFVTITNIANTTATYTTPNLTQTTCYRAVVQNGVCPAANSPSFCVQVDQPPVAGTINQADITICQGLPVGNIVLSGSSGNIIWESSTDCPNFSTLTTINNTSSTLNVGALNTTTCFRARVSRGVCPSVVSNVFTATILPSQPGTVQSSQTVCLGTDPNQLTLTNYTGNILRWERSNDGFITLSSINNTTPNYSPTGLTTITCFRAIVQNNSCTAPSGTACVRVDQPTVAGTVSSDKNPVCEGGSVKLTLSGNTGSVLRWESSEDPTFTTLTVINSQMITINSPSLTRVTYFRAVVQNGVCPIQITVPLMIGITINTERGVLGSDQTVCSNNPNGASPLILTGLIGNVIRWESSADGFVTANSIQYQSTTFTPFNITRTTQYRVFVNTPNCGQTYTNPVTVTLIQANQGGTVNANMTVCRSANTGTLTLTGYSGIILGWDRSVNGQAFTAVSPVNNTASLTFTNLTQTTIYRVRVQSICGLVYSTSAEVKVVSDPVGGTLFFNQTVCSGQTPQVLLLTGYNGSIKYWESSIDNGVTWTTVAGTTPIFRPSNINQTTLFRARVETECRGTYSSVVTLTVPQGSAGTLSQDMTICGTPASGTLTLSGYTGTIAAWEGSTDNFITVQPYGILTPTFAFENLTTTTQYRVRVNIGGCYLYSNPVKVTVLQNLSAGFVSPDQTVCEGSAPQRFVLEGYSGKISRWESSTDCFGQQINLIANNTPTHTSGALVQTTCFRAVVFYPECGELNSLPAKVTVIPLAVGGTIASDQTVCGTLPVNPLVLSGYSGTIIRWESSTDNFASVATISHTTDTYTPNTPNTTTKYRAVLTSKGCGDVYSGTVTVSVIANAVAGTLSSAQTICTGTAPNPLTLSGYTGDVLYWESSNNSNFTTIQTINNVTATLSPGVMSQSRCYRAVVGVNGCGTATSNSVCITVNNPPVGGTLITNQTVCLGATPNALILTGYSGQIIQWQSSTNNFATFTIINNATPVYNPGGMSQTTQFRVLVRTLGCGDIFSTTATITINPNTSVGGTLSANQTVCQGDLNPITLNLTGHSGTIIRWESSDNNFQSYNTITNTGTSYTIPVPPITTKYRVLVQGAGCPSAYSSVVTITVTPSAQAGILARVGTGTPNCGSNTGTVQLNNYVGTILNWQQSTDGGVTWTDFIWDLARYDYTISTRTLFRVVLSNPTCGIMYSPSIEVAPALGMVATPYRDCLTTGKIVAEGFGGTPNYTYALTPNVGQQSGLGVFTDVPVGTYTVTVKDKFNCVATATIVIPSFVTAPRIIGVTPFGNNSAKVVWESVAPGGNSVEFEIQYRPVGSSTWVSASAGSTTEYLITDIEPNTPYEVQVRVRCLPSTVWSAWSPSTVFNTQTRTFASVAHEVEISIYPNPTKGILYLQTTSTENSKVTLYDVTGREMLRKELILKENEPAELNLTGVASGIYHLRVVTKSSIKTLKVVIE